MRRILWFRRDLRVKDNSILSLGGDVLPIFIFDSNILDKLDKYDKRVNFIYQNVLRLKKELKDIGLDLAIFYGNPIEIISYLQKLCPFDEIVASGDYDSYALERDAKVSYILNFNLQKDTYIFDKNDILKDDSSPYLVFTPYYNKSKEIFTSSFLSEYKIGKNNLLKYNTESRTDYNINFHFDKIYYFIDNSIETRDIKLKNIGFEEIWLNNEILLSPQEKLNIFSYKIDNYQENRDFLAQDSTSNLSLDLRFGTISIREILRWLIIQKKESKGIRETKESKTQNDSKDLKNKNTINTEPFFRQLMFREFYAYLLSHFSYLENNNFKYKFYGVYNEQKYNAFCNGKTGIAIIDASIRQLLETGMMHNRARMISASFFTKNLLLPWKIGETFFAKHLLDYDASSNILSWQWSAGTGVDPQPYFRIFNPYLQSKKFDFNAKYIKTFIPELKEIDSVKIFDEKYMSNNYIKNYPKPIVSISESSKIALEYFKNQKC